MSWKTSAAIIATTITVATGALAYTAPRSASELHDVVRDQQSGDLADSQDTITDNHRDRGTDHANALNDTRNGQHSPRPRVPHGAPERPRPPRLPVRLP